MRVWSERSVEAPVPMHVKRSIILRLGLPNATWIETGTYLGDTTGLLAAQGGPVISIEPAAALPVLASERMEACDVVIHGGIVLPLGAVRSLVFAAIREIPTASSRMSRIDRNWFVVATSVDEIYADKLASGPRSMGEISRIHRAAMRTAA